jgi:hypothetical protein
MHRAIMVNPGRLFGPHLPHLHCPRNTRTTAVTYCLTSINVARSPASAIDDYSADPGSGERGLHRALHIKSTKIFSNFENFTVNLKYILQIRGRGRHVHPPWIRAWLSPGTRVND